MFKETKINFIKYISFIGSKFLIMFNLLRLAQLKILSNSLNIFCIIIFLCFGFYLSPVKAQGLDKITLTITPPLIKNNINPGQVWQSAIKLVNNNPKEIKAYVQVKDFKSGKESGTVKFLNFSQEKNKDKTNNIKNFALSQWITVNPGPIILPPFESRKISFKVNVPVDAEAGGHYAAFLVGTKPPDKNIKGTNIKISSLLASLLLLNVSGDTVEKGKIREFSTDRKFYTNSKINFKVRFSNTGNVHIQPRGDIKIYDFYNKEKKIIKINHNTEFGNVLPKSTREWNFSWNGGNNLLDMGRYRAELTLNYGEKNKQTINQTVYFWVLFLRPLLIVIGSLFVFILIIILIVRSYIRRAIIKTQAEAGFIAPASVKKNISNPPTGGNILDLKTEIKKQEKNKNNYD